MFSRITVPPLSNDYILIGLMSALDFNGRAIVAPQLLSRDEIIETDATGLIKSRIQLSRNERMLRIMDMIN